MNEGQSVVPTPIGSDMPFEALCACKTCSFDMTIQCRVNSPMAAKELKGYIPGQRLFESERDWFVALCGLCQVPSAPKNALGKEVPAVVFQRTGLKCESNLI